jgi:hypothetical protein
MPPIYGKGGRSGLRRVRASVGMSNPGQVNLLRNKRGAGGRYESTSNALPVYELSKRYWASSERYRKQAFSGQLKTLTDEINEWAKHIKEDAHKVLYNAMLPTFQKSQVYCPVSPEGSRPSWSSGELKRSGKLIVQGGLEKASKNAEVAITYGGNGIPFYAVYVHEIPRRHTPPTRHKFLEAAIKEDMQDIKRRIDDGMRKIT